MIADRGDELAFVKRVEQTKRIAAADEDRIDIVEIGSTVSKLRRLESHPRETLAHDRRIAVAIFLRERRKDDSFAIAEEVIDELTSGSRAT